MTIYSMKKLLTNSVLLTLISPLLPIVALMHLCCSLDPKDQPKNEKAEMNGPKFDESVTVQTHSAFMTEDSPSDSFLTV